MRPYLGGTLRKRRIPNQHAGGVGLPGCVAQNHPIENAILRHTFGTTHVCRPGDFRVMSVEQVGLALKPNGYPAENPGMDLLPVAMT